MSKRNHPEPRQLTLLCKRLINPVDKTVIEDGFIEITNGKILKIGRIEPGYSPKGELLDYSGKTIIPGLVETHGHLYGGGLMDRHYTNDRLASLYLAAGVTTARCPGSMEPDSDLALRARIDSGRFTGPRLFLSGEYIDMEPAMINWFDTSKTPEEARLKIDHWIGQGATSVKIYARMHGEILAAAIQHGHDHGVKVIAHVGAVSFREAIEMGIDELFHGVICCPETWPADMKAVDYKRIFEYVPTLNLAETDVPAMLRLAAEAGVIITPTTAVIQPLDLESRTQRDQKKFYAPDAYEKLVSGDQLPGFPDLTPLYKKQIEFIHMAYEVGCTLSTGTDITNYLKLPGFSLYDELEIFSLAGVPNMDILKAATYNGACAIGRSDLFGSLAPGKLADLVVLNEDPLVQISNTREVHRVIKSGVVYDPQTIYEPLIGKIR
jgi:hypothetical protein